MTHFNLTPALRSALRAFVCCLLIVSLVGCAASPQATQPVVPGAPVQLTALQKVVNADRDVLLGVKLGIQVLKNLRGANQITVAEQVNVAKILKRINDIAISVNNTIKPLASLDPNTAVSIKLLIDPILKELQNALNSGLIPVKDPAALTTVNGFLSGIAATLTIINNGGL